MSKGYSERGLFGDIHHYDEHGNKTGTSSPSLFGGYDNYDNHGNKVGHSDMSLFGGYNHYNNTGHKIGHSDPSLFGGYSHYDSSNQKIGSSDQNLFGGYTHNSSDGCYIATAVYGSYDCPQVWTLRRFRDFTLAKSRCGRAFIRIYYATSPTLVKYFGKSKWFKRLWQRPLDKLVEKLQNDGYKATPYNDGK